MSTTMTFTSAMTMPPAPSTIVTMTSPDPTTVAPPATTSSQGGGGGGGGGGPTSSPLLFFVALGFGVVFTNLWIIVGVKYCFRYNQRNRRAQQDENGEPIDLTAMPHGPRRRRREKKLMTMDEVNERFPLIKYKQWMTTRAEEGLPTAGGVAAPSDSRAASIRNAEGILHRRSGEERRPSTPETKKSMDEIRNSPNTDASKAPEIRTSSDALDPPKAIEEPKPEELKAQENKPQEPITKQKDEATAPIAPARTNESDIHPDDLDDDDQIQMAVPTEMMANPGDSCAICIDILEDDDDVRGLTCGHAFHASCLDPWLTARRACCPLCKADYYVPKPRPEGEAAAEADRQSGRRHPGQRMDMPHPPQYAFMAGRRPRMLMPGRFMVTGGGDGRNDRVRYGLSALRRPGNRRTNQQNHPVPLAPNSATSNPDVQHDDATWRSRVTPALSNFRMPAMFRRGDHSTPDQTQDSAAPEVNNNLPPAELEAGQR